MKMTLKTITALVSLLFLMESCSYTKWFYGNWEGKVKSEKEEYDVSLFATSPTNAKVNYQNKGCSGDWIFVKYKKKKVYFKENLTTENSSCFRNPEIVVELNKDKTLKISYYLEIMYPGKTIATGSLKPKIEIK